MSKCCGSNKRILSNACCHTDNCPCVDVCVTPQCGEPDFLTVLTPVVYDEIGINLCQTISIETILANFPTTAYVTTEIIDIAFEVTGDTPVTITPIAQRPNCYQVTLTNLTVTFVVKLYDCCKRLLDTATLTNVVYLPADITAAGYDADTNPSSVTLELFAPYGVSYTDGAVATPELNVIGFSSTNNTINQGLNLMAIPKVLDLDVTDGTITVGLTLITKVIYFVQYQLPHNGKAIVSKGTLSTSEDSLCMDFVSGSLLDRSIKPLEAFNPCDSKEKCPEQTDFNPC